MSMGDTTHALGKEDPGLGPPTHSPPASLLIGHTKQEPEVKELRTRSSGQIPMMQSRARVGMGKGDAFQNTRLWILPGVQLWGPSG
jgi:hypothetical protein